MDKLTFIAQKSFSLYSLLGDIVYGRNIWRHVWRKSCLPDRFFDSLYTGSGVEWMTYAVSRGCAKCHLLADSITGVLIMSLNERFEFQQLHIPHQQYLQIIAFDSLRMGIAHFFCFWIFFFNTRIIITIKLLLLGYSYYYSVRFSVQFWRWRFKSHTHTQIRKCKI